MIIILSEYITIIIKTQIILKFIKKIKNYKLDVPGSIKNNAILIYNKPLKINVKKTY